MGLGLEKERFVRVEGPAGLAADGIRCWCGC